MQGVSLFFINFARKTNETNNKTKKWNKYSVTLSVWVHR